MLIISNFLISKLELVLFCLFFCIVKCFPMPVLFSKCKIVFLFKPMWKLPLRNAVNIQLWFVSQRQPPLSFCTEALYKNSLHDYNIFYLTFQFFIVALEVQKFLLYLYWGKITQLLSNNYCSIIQMQSKHRKYLCFCCHNENFK